MNLPKRHLIDMIDLMSEWDWGKNAQIGLNPSVLSHGSTKKAFWICNQGHSFQARIDHRCIMKSNCPYCAGKVAIMGVNDIATLNPELLDEWDYNKNKLPPSNYKQGSNKKVWWKCSICGYEWQTQIIHRALRGHGCPECAKHIRSSNRIKKLVCKKGSLQEHRPDLVLEWDAERNFPLTPSDVTTGSNKTVWWVCRVCNYSYKKTVAGRNNGNGCPACNGKVVVGGYNDLASKFPNLVLEWHPTKNKDLMPTQITPFNDKRIWWKCSECDYVWNATIYSRTGLGTGCPACSNRVVISSKNDLNTTHPNLSLEWHPTKNGELTPLNVVFGSNKKVWWLCSKGHSWQAVIYSRKSGRGCPICSGELFTSFPEQAIYYYLSKVTNAINRYKFDGYEIDIYLPDISTGIEYNGRYYHRNRHDKDTEKVRELSKKGIRIIRIEEGKQNAIKGDIIFYKYINSNYKNLDIVINTIIEMLLLPMINVDIEKDTSAIHEMYLTMEKSNSLAQKYPWLVDEWNYESNGTLTPWQVSYGSHKKVWWKCKKCNYEWNAAVSSRKKSGCPRCAGRIATAGFNDLASQNPKLAKEWDFEKNSMLPTEVTKNSQRYTWWKCDNGHSWYAQIKSRNQGSDCPVCYKIKHE